MALFKLYIQKPKTLCLSVLIFIVTFGAMIKSAGDRVQMMSDEMLTVGFAWLWFLCGLCFGFWWLFDENIDG